MTKKLGFGAMRLPLTDPNDAGSIDMEQLKMMVDTFIDRGFTYFDTAWMYCNGKSEAALGEALVARHPRNTFTLTTKLPHYKLHDMADRDRIFDEQRRRTRTDHFDYYLLHNINSESVTTFEKYNCFDWIISKKKEGLVGTIGFSFHDGPELLEKVLEAHPEMEFVQLQLNYLDWESMGIQSRKCYEICQKHGKPVIVMEPVKGGTLARVPEQVERLFKSYDSDMSVPSWAIRFAAGLDGVMMVLSGMSNMEQLIDNTGYMSNLIPLNADEHKIIEKAVALLNGNLAIQCTGCSYCTVHCPAKIAIPKYFSLYNADLQEVKEKGWFPQEQYYDAQKIISGAPADCLKCGQCEKLCPQHLPIRKLLEEVQDHFENHRLS